MFEQLEIFSIEELSPNLFKSVLSRFFELFLTLEVEKDFVLDVAEDVTHESCNVCAYKFLNFNPRIEVLIQWLVSKSIHKQTE